LSSQIKHLLDLIAQTSTSYTMITDGVKYHPSPLWRVCDSAPYTSVLTLTCNTSKQLQNTFPILPDDILLKLELNLTRTASRS